jgi:hypothetical protein
MNDHSPDNGMTSESFLAGQNADYVEALQAQAGRAATGRRSPPTN